MAHLRAIVILALVSALATLCYLSIWSNLGYDKKVDTVFNNLNKAANRFRPNHQEQHPPEQSQTPPAPQQPTQEQPAPTTQQSIFSKHNARLAALNTKAFVTFCSSKLADREAGLSTVLDADDTAFTSYAQWIDHIKTKNSHRTTAEEQQQQRRPVFMERPLKDWIINLTSIIGPCDRLVYSSAHCINYLTKEHEYLVPATPEQKATTAKAPIMHFHIFWRGPISDKLSLSAHSFIFTQPLQRAHLNLWIDSADLPNGEPEDYTQNEFSAPLVSEPLSKYITIHAWDQEAELAHAYPEDINQDGTETEWKKLEQSLQASKPVKPVALSDEARFLILNRNGGIYLDADVLLLKDMSPLFDSGLEFAYEWSMTRMYNTAILRLYKESTVARRILDGARNREMGILKKKLEQLEQQREGTEEQQKGYNQMAKRGEMRPEEIYHPARLRQYLRPQDSRIQGNGLIMMPVAVFDPLWLRVDRAEAKGFTDSEKMLVDLRSFPEAFSVEDAVCPFPQQQQQQAPHFTAGPEVFFQGAFAYHWHNNWATPIDAKSWMGQMRQGYEDFNDRTFVIIDPANNKFRTMRELPLMTLIEPKIVGDQLEITAASKSVRVPLNPSHASLETREVTVWKEVMKAADMGDEVAELLTEYLGVPSRLVHKASDDVRPVVEHAPGVAELGFQPETAFADNFPILCLSEESVKDINTHLETPVTALNFRPNLVISGVSQPFEEDTWCTVDINGITYYFTCRCTRCDMPNVDPVTGVKDKLQPQKTLQKVRRVDKGKAAKFYACVGINVVPNTVSGVIRAGDVLDIKEVFQGERMRTGQPGWATSAVEVSA
ncbi:hypothetical protein BG004_000817 [Podila humilis]|nr:hypothetical protein BG004_000817 [Podila humilis]